MQLVEQLCSQQEGAAIANEEDATNKTTTRIHSTTNRMEEFLKKHRRRCCNLMLNSDLHEFDIMVDRVHLATQSVIGEPLCLISIMGQVSHTVVQPRVLL